MKLAVIIDGDDKHRQSESIRVALGLTLCDDTVDLFILDAELKETDEVKKNLEMLEMSGGAVFSNDRRNDFQLISEEEIGKRLLNYDSVFAY